MATEATQFAFAQWLKQRGGSKSDELIQVVTAVREFIQKHGDSRFTRMLDVKGSWKVVEDAEFEIADEQKTTDKVGYKYLDEFGSFVYLIYSRLWQSEICEGRDPALIANELVRLKHMRPSGRSNSVTRNLPRQGKTRVYEIKSSILHDDDNP